ncbi:MAG: 4-hydroxy-tetrahydrodipicolinate reductase, partial [Flavisolibacter sp.]|nr:4-hydroxy-tetrahydrodipicolinate reductase [Flavisolibacter sp.]
MHIVLIGYGKMGRMIEEIAEERGHEIVLRIDADNQDDFTEGKMKTANVAIEFTAPESAYENVKKCIDFGIPVVSG